MCLEDTSPERCTQLEVRIMQVLGKQSPSCLVLNERWATKLLQVTSHPSPSGYF